jgi:L-ribulose-5-phosphate 3-epimerase
LKIGLNAGSFPANVTIPQGLRIAKRAGFDAVEFNLSESGYLRPDSDQKEVERLRSAAENMSLEPRSLSSAMLWEYSLTSNNPDLVEKAKDTVRKGLEIARMLGADISLVTPGVVTSEVPYEVAYERSQAALKELSKDAERENVIIGIENAWNKFLLSPLEMRDFIDGIGSEYVGAYFDIGSVLVSGYPEQWIRILGSRIKKVHARDFKLSTGNSEGFANILEGDVEWIAVRNALREIGYDDLITAEIPGYKTLPDLGIRHAGEAMKRIFKGTRSKAEK